MSEELQIPITCPKCKTVGQVPSSWGGGRIKCIKCNTPIDVPINYNQLNDSTRRKNNSELISTRNNAANRISGWGEGFGIICNLSGLVLFIAGCFAVSEDALRILGILLMVTGVTTFISGFLFDAVMKWGAELLRCIGRIEDKLDK